MRVVVLLLVILVLTSCSDEATRPDDKPDPAWQLDPDSLNIAVLLVDHETRGLLGANVSHYVACNGCESGDFPLYPLASRIEGMVIYAWLHSETSELVFWATLEDDGGGHISYPDSFLPAEVFKSLGESISLPKEAELLRNCRNTEVDECIAQAGTAWAAVAHLDIVAEFAARGMSVGFFKYDGDMYVKDPPATWVFFLCCGEVPE